MGANARISTQLLRSFHVCNLSVLIYVNLDSFWLSQFQVLGSLFFDVLVLDDDNNLLLKLVHWVLIWIVD